MKAKNILLLAALAFSFMACEKKEPFDTQSANDAPIILVPYETADGKVYGTVYNPSPYVDSVIVTPSAYTTVNWYLDKALVYTGNKINMCFPTGTYDLLIEAVTTAGKRTTRSGVLTVKPAATDPYSGAPAAGRHFVPNTVSTISGTNLTQVVKLVLSRDLYAKDTVCTIDVTTTDDASISFTLPALADGKYYLRLQDAEGNLFGADAIEVHNASVVLSGYEAFVPNKEWTITGAKLENVASVTIDETVITEITKTATTITFIAPDAEVGEHTLSLINEDGSNVFFLTEAGLVTEVTTVVSAETTIWEGSCVTDWGDSNVHIDKTTMSAVPAGATVYVYYNVPDADYYSLRIVVAPDWSADIVAQIDGMNSQPSPFSFTYNSTSKDAAEADGKDGILVTGHGLEIVKVTYK